MLVLTTLPTSAFAIGPNAVIYPAGWNTNAVTRGDDTSNLVVGLPFTLNWLGTNYSQVYLNMNGNITFGSSNIDYTPDPLPGLAQPMIAPFWADVDTRYVGAPNLMYYSNLTTGSVPAVNGRPAVLFTWSNVMRYNGNTQSSDTTNTFQLVLIDRSDTGAGNFDFWFNYDKMVWDTGTASAGYPARVGWTTAAGDFDELAGSGTTGALLDSGPAATSLIQNSLNSGGQLGRYIWQVRNGGAPNAVPVVTVTNRTLEGNCSAGYLGYTGAGDATATDSDGWIASFRNTLPAVLPTGTSSVAWTATDDAGSSATATQSITVTDTTPPSAPTLTSPSHALSTWSSNPTIAISGTGVTDACSGLNGFSYSWSANSAATPDTVVDSIATSAVTVATTNTVVATDTTTVDYQPFATSVWPSDWTRSDTTYVGLTSTAGRFYDSYAAEATTTAGTRRTLTLYRDYNLAGYNSATLSFWDLVAGFAGGTDYERVEYSTDGGTTWTQLQNLTAATAGTQYSYGLPVGGTVRVRFSASINAVAEYASWDVIKVQGFKTTSTPVVTTSTTTSLSTTNTPGEGVWYFNIRSRDAAGNWSASTSLGPFFVDTVKPTTTSNAPSSWVTSTVNVSLTATDPSGPIAYTRYKLDAAAVATYSAAFPVSGDGTHTLQFWSADSAGNVETTHSTTVRIDGSAPTTPTALNASAPTSTSVALTWTASTDAVSGVSYYVIYRNGSQIATTSATSYTDSGLVSYTLYTYYVVAVDVAGNRSGNSANASATTLNSLPIITLVNRVLEGNVANGYASYNATASGDATATDLDGTIASFVSSPTLPATLTVGVKSIVWTATDNRGGVATATQSVTVTDTTPPTLPTLSSPSHTTTSWSNNPTATINWTTATDVCTGLGGYSVVWSQNATALPDTTMDATASATTTMSARGDGTWYFNVRTVDNAGNWSATCVSYGPIRIDTVKPTTTSNAPAVWTSGTVNVSLTATDPSGPVAYSRYKLDAAAVATYTVAIAVSGDGTHTLQFWSADSAGNVEATRSATVLIDNAAPSTPTSVGASAVSTTSIEVTWNPSTENTSGVAYYRIYRNGSLVGTTTGTLFTDTGLTPGFTYPYYIVAVSNAGVSSANSTTANGNTPAGEIWMSMTTNVVTLGAVSPGLASTVASATTVKVGGVGNLTYDFWCSAADFSNLATASVTPTMPAGTMSYSTSGWTTVGLQPFTNAPTRVDTAAGGTKYVWQHDYRFDYVLSVPWAFDPGTYTTNVMYTVVER